MCACVSVFVCVCVCVCVCDSDLSVLWWIHPVHVTYRLNHLYKETDYPFPAKMAANTQKHTKMQNTHTYTHTHACTHTNTHTHRQTHVICGIKKGQVLVIDLWTQPPVTQTRWWFTLCVCVCVHVCVCVCLLTPGLFQSSPLLSLSHKLPVNSRTDRTREKEGGRDRKRSFYASF